MRKIFSYAPVLLPKYIELYLASMSLSLPLKLSFAAPLTLLALVGCSSEGGDGQGDQESSVVQSEEVTKLTRSNESLAWELERLRLKVVTVDGEDMVLAKQTGLFHHDTERKPFTGRAVSEFENGKPKHDASFYEGKLDGVEKYWHPNGQVWKEKMWLEGEYHGFITEWDANGNIKSRKRFHRGEEKTNQ